MSLLRIAEFACFRDVLAYDENRQFLKPYYIVAENNMQFY